MRGGVLPGHRVLGEASVGGTHLVEGGDAVPGFEFVDAGADAVNDAGNVISRVGLLAAPFRTFPVWTC